MVHVACVGLQMSPNLIAVDKVGMCAWHAACKGLVLRLVQCLALGGLCAVCRLWCEQACTGLNVAGRAWLNGCALPSTSRARHQSVMLKLPAACPYNLDQTPTTTKPVVAQPTHLAIGQQLGHQPAVRKLLPPLVCPYAPVILVCPCTHQPVVRKLLPR